MSLGGEMTVEQIVPWVLLASILAFAAWWIFRPSSRSRKADFRVITASAVMLIMTGGFIFWQSGFRPPRPGLVNPGQEIDLQACPDYENFNRCSPSLPDGVEVCSWADRDWQSFCRHWLAMEINWQKEFCFSQCRGSDAEKLSCILCCDTKYKDKHREDLVQQCRNFVCENMRQCGENVDCSAVSPETPLIESVNP
ncbi:MAG: hypothetical protein ACO3LE_00775 [Bdellovibrionota bacterium]